MGLKNILIANRGEIAVRICRAASGLGVRTTVVYSEDDAQSLHVKHGDAAVALSGTGPSAYLDGEQFIALAKSSKCDAIHPGYGFLSENATFARRCAEEEIIFVGPAPETLELFGDKAQARALAERIGVPVLEGASEALTADAARAIVEKLDDDSAVMIKAIGGGGGRGMAVVERGSDFDKAFERCRMEAQSAFGNPDLYLEQYVPRARHIEVQVVGDGTVCVSHLWERECTIQRRHQKIMEFAPSPWLSEELRAAIIGAAVAMAREANYLNVGTFEFLVYDDDANYAFIEANPRLQVEHTVTEEVTGVDLVAMQLRIAGGESLADLHLNQSEIPLPVGFAIQSRVNLESHNARGAVQPSGGTLTAFEPVSGPGIRVDTFGYAGYETNPRYDSLLAKVIVTGTTFSDTVRKSHRALREFRIEGVETNIPLLLRILELPELESGGLYTRLVEDRIADLANSDNGSAKLFFESGAAHSAAHGDAARAMAGAKVDSSDPLAVLAHGKSSAGAAPGPSAFGPKPTVAPAPSSGPAGTSGLHAPLQGTIVKILVAEGDTIHREQDLVVMEAMKMQHYVTAETSGIVRKIAVSVGDTVYEGHPLLFVEESDVEADDAAAEEAVDLDYIRPDLEEALERHALGLDAARPDAVEKRRKTGHRTARENIADLCDPGTFVEYGPLVIAAQRLRRDLDDLIKNTPADGMIAGVGRINGDRFDEAASQCAIVHYDYTVLAGTQGKKNHAKKDRIFEIAHDWRLPVVAFCEGGGGRPGDTDHASVAGLNCLAFNYFARLSGSVPLVGVTTGRCFAGNAIILGCCDVIIATEGSNIGVGGPAMIEGGGLGVFRPEEVGPMDVQVPNGVVDLPVKDEAEAVAAAKRYLSYFQGPLPDWECPDQRILRTIIPEDRLRLYDIRKVVDTLADSGSVLELRRHWGDGMVTALIRIEGRPVGVVANNPAHLAGAIDSDGADKAARFIQLCDAFDIPILFLCDCPGIMVGPEVEKTAVVRHACRMMVAGANASVPFFTIVLRKGYGLGAQAMAGGSFNAPMFVVSWPTGEFGGMGLEGAVKLGYRKEIAAIEDPKERMDFYEDMVAKMYEKGKAISTASHFEIDDVIDPKDSRQWIMGALKAASKKREDAGPKRPFVDTW